MSLLPCRGFASLAAGLLAAGCAPRSRPLPNPPMATPPAAAPVVAAPARTHHEEAKNTPPPAESAFLTDVVQISAGYSHACALHRDGRVSCWGDNGVGQVGVPIADTPTSNRFTRPVWVLGLPPAKHVEAGSQHTCAIARDDTLWCWGSAGFNVYVSTLSVAGTVDLPYLPRTAHAGEPRMIVGPDARPLRARSLHLQGSDDRVCVGTLDDVTTWQSSQWLDPASAGPSNRPAHQSSKFPAASSVAARGLLTCAIGPSSTGRAMSCWREGQQPPTPVSWPTSAAEPVEVRMAEYPVCVLDAAGEIYCWKATVSGPFWQKPPVHVTWPSKAPTVAFAVGESAVCTVGRDGRVDCFLAEPQGMTPEEKRRMWAGTGMGPHPIALVDNAIGVAMGGSRDVFGFGFACAALARPNAQGAEVLCWGDNDSGQIGDGTENPALRVSAVLGSTSPVPQNRHFSKQAAEMDDELLHGSDWRAIPGSSK